MMPHFITCETLTSGQKALVNVNHIVSLIPRSDGTSRVEMITVDGKVYTKEVKRGCNRFNLLELALRSIEDEVDVDYTTEGYDGHPYAIHVMKD